MAALSAHRSEIGETVQIRGGPVADYAAARPTDDCGSPKENMFTKSAGARVSTPEVVGPCRTRFLCCCCSASDPTEPMVRIGQKMGNDQSSMKLEIGNHAQVIGALSDVSIYPAHPSSPVKSSPTSSHLPPQYKTTAFRAASSSIQPLREPGSGFRIQPHQLRGRVETPSGEKIRKR